jgi:uncharacterized DUF497 family protein
VEFEWDEAKRDRNRRTHGVDFEEAAAAFLDPLGVEKPELRTSGSEERFIRVAHSPRGQLLLTIFSERGRRIRIISSRRATRREVKQYEEGI